MTNKCWAHAKNKKNAYILAVLETDTEQTTSQTALPTVTTEYSQQLRGNLHPPACRLHLRLRNSSHPRSAKLPKQITLVCAHVRWRVTHAKVPDSAGCA